MCGRIGTNSGWVDNFFLNLQLWPLVFLQPLDQNKCLVFHWMDPTPASQGRGMTFNCQGGQKTLKTLNKIQIDSKSLSLIVFRYSQWKLSSSEHKKERLVTWQVYTRTTIFSWYYYYSYYSRVPIKCTSFMNVNPWLWNKNYYIGKLCRKNNTKNLPT